MIRRKIIAMGFLSLVVSWAFLSCEKGSDIHYPTPVPAGDFASFLPGIVSTDSFEFNSLFSADGKTFYFADGNHDILQTTFDGEQWSTAVLSPFAEKDFKECDPAFSPDGNRLYYISTRKRSPADSTDDFDIWYVEKQGESWSAPKNLEVVNSDSSEYYVSLAKNGNLYFASNRAGGLGSFDVYVSKLINGEYTMPENLGAAINNDHLEHDPFISGDERLLIYTSVGREGGIGRGDLYFSVKDADGKWSEAKNLGPKFNGPEYDFCPYITPDEKYFFFSNNQDIRWINIEELYKVTGK